MASSKPRLLDLFCGAGGAAMGYARAGFEVVGVDIKPQPRYPFEFEQCDALAVLEGRTQFKDIPRWFDAIHASPPCQLWSGMHGSGGPDLITPLRPLLEATGLPYVIENVPGAPLRRHTMLCGSMFGLGVRRHRWFEIGNAEPMLLTPPCVHDLPKRYQLYDHGKLYMSSVVHVFGTGGGKGREHWQEAMGIDWTNDTDELREAIPPAYTEFIGAQLMAHIRQPCPA